MSADNGVYILISKNPKYDPESTWDDVPFRNSKYEYRVCHAQAIENIYYDETVPHPEKPDYPSGNWHSDFEYLSQEDMDYEVHKKYQEQYARRYDCHDPKVVIKNCRDYWKASPVFYSENAALVHAYSIYRKLDICEYGISSIEVEEVF